MFDLQHFLRPRSLSLINLPFSVVNGLSTGYIHKIREKTHAFKHKVNFLDSVIEGRQKCYLKTHRVACIYHLGLYWGSKIC